MKRASAVWLAAALITVSACSGRSGDENAGVPREFGLARQRVTVVVPAGWIALDQGRQKRFQKSECEIVLENLGPAPPEGADWGLTLIGYDQRRDVKSRRATIVDGREAVEIETWNRLAHTNPQRALFLTIDGDLLALHTPREADPDTVKAFEAIRDSLHFAPASSGGIGRR